MGDWTSGQVTIYACPPERVRAVVEILCQYDLAPEGQPIPAGALLLGEAYETDSMLCGSAAEIAAELRKTAPEAFFETQEDPKYEWLGDLQWHHPLHGDYDADCDSSGRPVFGVNAIREAVAADALDELLGEKFMAAATEIQTTPGPQGILRFALDEDAQERHDEEEGWREDEAHALNSAGLYDAGTVPAA